MALLDKGLKQRMVGALVLLALAVIFVPMLLTGENQPRYVEVQAPPMPVPDAPLVALDEPVALVDEQPWAESAEAVVESTPVAAPTAAPTRLDARHLPISWSVQLASLSSMDNAQSLQNSLRSQGYTAYIRKAQGMHRVFVGPFIERAEAERLKSLLNQRQRLNGFVVRFQPENQ